MAELRGPLMSPGFWLHHAALAWRQAFDAELRPLGLTHTQFSLLAAVSWLNDTSGPPTQQQTATHAGADRMMASKVLTTLADRGLVGRESDPVDGRAKRLVITAAGKSLVLRGAAAAATVDAMFFGTGPDRERLRNTMQGIAERRS